MRLIVAPPRVSSLLAPRRAGPAQGPTGAGRAGSPPSAWRVKDHCRWESSEPIARASVAVRQQAGALAAGASAAPNGLPRRRLRPGPIRWHPRISRFGLKA